MTQNTRLFAVAAALCGLLTGPAAAGPISWSWTAQIVGESGKPLVDRSLLDLGTHQVVERDGSTSTYYATTDFGGRGMDSGTASNKAEILLASSPTRNYNLSSTPVGAEAERQFLVSLGVTDQSSGQSRQIDFHVHGSLSLSPYTNDGDVYLHTDGWQYLFRLGDNQYEVNIGSGTGSASGSVYVYADITPTRAVETPEPATLAMAGIGLLGTVGLRWRKRKNSQQA